MAHTTRAARALLALATFGALFAAPAAASPAPAPAPACTETAAEAGPCTDACRRKRDGALDSCQRSYNSCIARGENPARCNDLRTSCRKAAEDLYRRCLITCTRRQA